MLPGKPHISINTNGTLQQGKLYESQTDGIKDGRSFWFKGEANMEVAKTWQPFIGHQVAIPVAAKRLSVL